MVAIRLLSVAGVSIATTALPGVLAFVATIGRLQLRPFSTMGLLVWQFTASILMLVASTRRMAQTLVGTVSPSVVHVPDVADRSSLSRK